MAVAPLWKGPALAKGERIVRFDSPNSAVVAIAGSKKRSRIEAAGAPMAAGPTPGQATDASGLKPIDLSLNATEQGWSPQRSAIETTLPHDTGGRISVGDELSVGLDHANGAADGRPTAETKVFYPEVATDTDAVVEPVSDGVSVSWLLRSPAAPDRLRLDLDGASASGIRIQEDGSLTLHGANGPVGSVSTPHAWDADGTAVQTRFVVDGGAVSVAVEHRGRDLTYPIAVDPVIRPTGQPAAILEQDDSHDTPARPTMDGWLHHTFQPPLFQFAEESTQKTITTVGTGDGSAWFSFDPIRNSAPYKVQFAGVALVRQGPGSGTCQRLGIANLDIAANWNASAINRSWTGDYTPGGSTPWNSTPAPPPTAQSAGPFLDCSGTPSRSFVEVCATSSCGPVGPSNSIVAFQLNASQVQAGAWSWSTFSGAYVYHRENVAPSVTATPSWTAANWDSFDEDATVNVTAHDDGVGLCGDASNGFPAVTVLRDPAASNLVLGSAGNDGCTGMTFDRPAPSDQTYALVVPGGTIPEGIRSFLLTTTDAVGNGKLNILQARADRSAPAVTLSGDLYTQRDTPIAAGGQRPMTVSATDGSTISAVTQRSGVQRIEIYVDDELVKTEEQTASGDSKPLSTTWTPATDTFTAGDYTMRVVTTDRVGNDQEQEFVVHAPCCGIPLDDATIPVGERLHQLGDVDGDGQADAVLVETATGTIAVRLGQGDGTFGPEQAWGTFGTAVEDLAVGDISGPETVGGEGDPANEAGPVFADLVARASSGSLVIRLSNGSSLLAPRPQGDPGTLQTTWPATRSLGLADVDGNGMADLWGVDAGNRQLQVGYSVGGAFESTSSWRTMPGTRDVDLADLDGDGLADLITYEPSDGVVRFHQSDGESFDETVDWGDGPVGSELATGDLNGDGRADGLFRAPDVGGQPGAVRGKVTDRHGGFVSGASRDLGSLAAAFDLQSVDLTGDGSADVVGTRLQGTDLLVRSAASVVPNPEDADTDPVDDEGASLLRGATATAKRAKPTVMISDDNALVYGAGLDGKTKQDFLETITGLGASRVRTIAYLGQIDRLHPSDEAGLAVVPGQPETPPLGTDGQPQTESNPPAMPRAFSLARDAGGPAQIADTVDDSRPEWIIHGGVGEWILVKNRFYLGGVRRVFEQIKTHNQVPKAKQLSVHLTITGGTKSWTECKGPSKTSDPVLRDQRQDDLLVRGCRTAAVGGVVPDATGLNSNPKRSAHAIAEVASHLRSEYGSTLASVGVWNEPNLPGNSALSTWLARTVGGTAARNERDAAALYGQIYAFTWSDLAARGAAGDVPLGFGELTSRADVSSGEKNSKLRTHKPGEWLTTALRAARDTPGVSWPGGRVRAQALAVHPYAHTSSPTQISDTYNWGPFGVGHNVDVVVRNGKRVKHTYTSIRTALKERADDLFLREGASGKTRPDIWATEFGYFNSKAGTLGWKNSSLTSAQNELLRKRWMVGDQSKTGAMKAIAEDGDAKVIGFWEVLEDPRSQINPGASSKDSDYGFIGSSATAPGPGAPTGDASYLAFGGSPYTNQVLKISGLRPYGKSPKPKPRKRGSLSAAAYARFNGMQWPQERLVARGIRKWTTGR